MQFLQNNGNEIWVADNLKVLMKTAGVECFLRSVVLKIERNGTRTKEMTLRSIKVFQNRAELCSFREFFKKKIMMGGARLGGSVG